MACRRRKSSSSKQTTKSSKSKSTKKSGENEAVKIVLDFLSKVEMAKSSEIAENTGLDKKVVDNVIKQLKKEGKIESPKRCYYALKK